MTFDEIRSVAAKLESDIANGPIVPAVTPDEIRRHLTARYDFTKPLDPDEVGADVEAMLRTWQVHVTHPRYFGLFNPSVTVASIVADTLVAMYNPQLATWRTSPAANEIERHTLAWLSGKFGLPLCQSCRLLVEIIFYVRIDVFGSGDLIPRFIQLPALDVVFAGQALQPIKTYPGQADHIERRNLIASHTISLVPSHLDMTRLLLMLAAACFSFTW